jgi:hypothetical protein
MITRASGFAKQLTKKSTMGESCQDDGPTTGLTTKDCCRESFRTEWNSKIAIAEVALVRGANQAKSGPEKSRNVA